MKAPLLNKFFLILCFVLGRIVLGETGLGALPPFWLEAEDEDQVERIFRSLSEEEILGQVFLVGYASELPTPEILAWLEGRNIGGIKIFGWNAENLTTLSNSIARMQSKALKTKNGIPLFVATDQEGGWVRHVKGSTSVTPGNLAIGATALPYDAYQTGLSIGRELKALGINMNFAPTVDVYVNPKAHVIGPRAFSSDPVLTGTLAMAYYRGMAKAGIISTAKHFPGHGNADGDSHGVLPSIREDYETLWNRDLLPYRLLISEKIPAILSGHLSFPLITGNNKPASLSPFFSREVVRNRLGFEGILMTDDLYMSGAHQSGLPFAEICVQALEAGNDMIMLSKTPEVNDEIWRSVLLRYRQSSSFRRHIGEAVRRIIRTKLDYIKPEGIDAFKTNKAAITAIPAPETQNFFLDLAGRSVTLLGDPDKIIPYTPRSDEKVLLAGQHRNFISYGKKRYPEADEFLFSYSPFYHANPGEKRAFVSKASAYDTIIFCMSNPNSLEVLEAIRGFQGRVIVFSILTPIYLREVPWVSAALAVYGWGEESFKAGFAVLRGDYEAEGKNPIGKGMGGGSP
jgi:beta-N-acetylhexosaminidase